MIKDLLDRFKNKNQTYEKMLYEMFFERVYYAAYFIIQDRDLAQDVAQETFLKAFKQTHTVKDANKLGAWLATIASRAAIDYLRKLKRWNDIATEDVFIEDELSKKDHYISEVETVIEDKVLRNLLFQELDQLSPEHKQVLLLKYFYDMTHDEMAEAIGITPGAVKTRLYRARIQLRKIVEQKPEVKEALFNAR